MIARLFGRRAPALEARGHAASPVLSSDDRLASMFGLMSPLSTAGEVVSLESALSVPAIWSAINFLARSMASLPVAVYDKKPGGRIRATGPGARIGALLNEAPNDVQSAYEFRLEQAISYLWRGRHVSWIERNPAGVPVNLWPLDMDRIEVARAGAGLRYIAGGVEYAAGEVLDLRYFPEVSRLQSRSPILQNRETIGLAIAQAKYAARIFSNGGVPAFAIQSVAMSPAAAARAQADLAAAFKDAAERGTKAVQLPPGVELHKLGVDPAEMQMVEARRFLIEEIARIYNLPPVFLQDLTHGAFANVEQQDLQFVKHTLGHLVKGWEGEHNLKLFGRAPQGRTRYLEANLAGVLRGDLLSRMDALGKAVTAGILMPNEARGLDNRPDAAGGDRIYLQGAMAPAESLGTTPAKGAAT